MAHRRILLAVVLLAAACATVAPEDRVLTAEALRLAEAKAAAGAFSGVVVIAREDRILLARAFGSTTRSTRFDVASLGKMFTSVAIAQLVERGVLSFDAPVGTYLPAFPNARVAGEVTIHHLLTHTSGIPDLPDDLFFKPPASLAGYLPFFTNAQLEFAPGAERSYSNSGFVLLGMILEAVTRTSYDDYLQEHVFRPARMRTASTVEGGPHGGAHVAADDLVRFFHALRHGKLVRTSTAASITTPRPGAPAPYGFGELVFARDRLVGHSGGSTGISADAYTYWQSGYTIVVLANLGAPASHEVAGGIRKLLEPRFQ